MKTIKQITDNAHITWLSKSRTINKGVADEMTVIPYGYLGTAVEEALTSLLDSIEKDIKDSKIQLIREDKVDSYNEALDDSINIINSHKDV